VSEISVPYLKYSEVRDFADKFLAQYHSSLDLPIPIEEVVEFQMGIDIFPMHGLATDFDGDNLEVEGYTSLHRKTITVDNDTYLKKPSRYRFTLAHEVGHIFMHSAVYESELFKNIDEWKDFIKYFPQSEYDKFEWQAYAFAGLVLVPNSPLERIIEHHLKEVINIVKEQGLNPKNFSEYIWDTVYERVGKDFEVSPIVINKRVDLDNIKKNHKF
jgi:Zn-dependent peptidase ImmA (M78 family)